MIRNVFLIGLIVVMVAVMILTWGSVGSAVMAYGLITMGCAMLYQRFMTNREESDYQMEE